jgi:hypothetical protein
VLAAKSVRFLTHAEKILGVVGTPIITSSDAEGAGALYRVSTLVLRTCWSIPSLIAPVVEPEPSAGS